MYQQYDFLFLRPPQKAHTRFMDSVAMVLHIYEDGSAELLLLHSAIQGKPIKRSLVGHLLSGITSTLDQQFAAAQAIIYHLDSSEGVAQSILSTHRVSAEYLGRCQPYAYGSLQDRYVDDFLTSLHVTLTGKRPLRTPDTPTTFL